MCTRPDIEFSAMPRTNDMDLRVVVPAAVHLHFGINIVDNSFKDPSLADGATLMRTDISPGVKLNIDSKDADVNAIDCQQLLGIVVEIVDRSTLMLSHLRATQ
mgnify:CR=1 FL=1